MSVTLTAPDRAYCARVVIEGRAVRVRVIESSAPGARRRVARDVGVPLAAVRSVRAA